MAQIIQNSRILVTGGAGFIGSNLAEALLAQENEVVVLDNFATGKMENLLPFAKNKAFRLIVGDIRDLPPVARQSMGLIMCFTKPRWVPCPVRSRIR